MPYIKADLPALHPDAALPWHTQPTSRRTSRKDMVDVRDAKGRIVANYVLDHVADFLVAAANAMEPEESRKARALAKPSSERTLDDWNAMGV